MDEYVLKYRQSTSVPFIDLRGSCFLETALLTRSGGVCLGMKKSG